MRFKEMYVIWSTTLKLIYFQYNNLSSQLSICNIPIISYDRTKPFLFHPSTRYAGSNVYTSAYIILAASDFYPLALPQDTWCSCCGFPCLHIHLRPCSWHLHCRGGWVFGMTYLAPHFIPWLRGSVQRLTRDDHWPTASPSRGHPSHCRRIVCMPQHTGYGYVYVMWDMSMQYDDNQGLLNLNTYF